MGEILARLLAQRRQGGGGGGAPQMQGQQPITDPSMIAAMSGQGGGMTPGMPPMGGSPQGGMGQDPMAALMQPGSQPPPQGDDQLQQMLAFLQQHSGLLSMLRNRRNQGMTGVQSADQY